jgi:protease-4
MAFARTAWRILVGIKDALVLIAMLLFFVLLYAVLSARPAPVAVRDGALLLKLDGAIVEEPTEKQPLELLQGQGRSGQREYAARDLIRALRAAAGDARIKAVALDLSTFSGGGRVSLHDVGVALDGVRAAKKPVLVYGTMFGDDAIQLAAHGSEVWVDPMGGALPTGPGGTHLYYAPLLDKLKITPHVFRVGTYKSAVEPYIRGDMSPEARANYQQLYGALWENWKAEVTRVRPRANVAAATTDPLGLLRAAGGDAARATVNAGFADRIGDPVQFGQRVAQVAGLSTVSKRPGAYAHTSLQTWLDANPAATGGKPIAVVTVAGLMVPGNGGPGQAAGGRIARLLDDALAQNPAALVVRVDSPGGAVVAGEEIRRAIARYHDKHIPVVVSMGNLAASGGYWVTTAADHIFAEPETITGSIGVFAVIPSFEQALTKIGVKADGVRTTPLAGEPDVFAGFSPEASALLQADVEHIYGRFLSIVGVARGKTPAQVDAIAQGRVWDGGTARQLGLVDQFGNLDDALAYAANRAGLKQGDWYAAYLQRPEAPLSRALREYAERNDPEPDPDTDTSAQDWTALVTQRSGAAMQASLDDLLRLGNGAGIQAYCAECPVTPRAAASSEQAQTWSLLSHLVALLS